MKLQYEWFWQEKTGRLLASSVAFVLAATLSIALLVSASQWYQARAYRLALELQEASHIAAMSQLIPALKQRAAGLQSAGDRQLLMPGESDAAAGANLQLAIATLAGKSDARITSITVRPGQAIAGLCRIEIDVNLTATWDALIALLGAIDLARPRMIVSGLTITDSAQKRDATQDTPLQISFSVIAFRSGTQ